MRKFDHPNIIKMYDLMQTSKNYYIVMQLCKNGDVKQYMTKRGVKFFKEEEAIFFLKQIAMGFRELHKHKVMHRDFKVDNLFIDESTIVIADLGFSKSGQDMFKTTLGTPLYMAPEVLKGEAYNNLADLWSVGVTFFEILFGTFPFNGRSEVEILRKMKYNSGDKLIIPTHINPVSEDCKDFLQKILEHDLRKRMSWSTFFSHPLFRVDEQVYASGRYAPLGSTMQMSMQINNRFEGYKCAAPPKEEILDHDFTGHSLEKTQEITEEFVDANAMEALLSVISQTNEESHKFDEINGKYNHEKNLVQFMREVAMELRIGSRHLFFNSLHQTSIL